MDMDLKVFAVVISLMFFGSFAHAEVDDGTQKICYITDKEMSKLARKGATTEIAPCTQKDLLVFDSRGYDNRNVAVAMARVCEVSSIIMAGEKTSMVGICVYTGNTLTLANEYRGSKK